MNLLFRNIASILLVFTLSNGYAQVLDDSLPQIISEIPFDKKSEVLNKYALQALRNETNQSFHYAQLAFELARKNNDLWNSSLASEIIGHYYYQKKHFDLALENFLTALSFADKITNETDTFQLVRAKQNLYISRIHIMFGNFQKALPYAERAYNFYDSYGDEQQIAESLYNYANVFEGLQKYKQAIRFYHQTLNLQSAIADQISMAKTLHQIGDVYARIKEYKIAKDYYLQALDISEKNGLKSEMAYLYSHFAEIYIKLDNLSKAQQYIGMASQHAETAKDNQIRLHFYKIARVYFDSTKNYKQALKYNELYFAIYDSIATMRNRRKIAEPETKYEAERKQKEIERLKHDQEIHELALKKERIQKYMLLLVIVMIMILGFVLIRIKVKSNRILTKQQKQLEKINEELKNERDKAKQLAQSRSMFVAKMSHEIRTPMNGVIGIIDILSQTKLNENQKELINIVKVSSNNLLTIINEILDYSKIEAGQITLESTNFILDVELYSIVKLMEFRAKDKGILLRTDIDPKAPAFVKGDPVKLKQIIINLVNNAIKFTEVGGVTIKINLIEQKGADYFLKFLIIDTGIGISEEGKNKLFKEFSQTDYESTRRHGGTGLGLAISKRIVHLMGGEIGVISDPGKGSTFWFTVTLNKIKNMQKEVDNPYKETHERDDIRKLKILVIEDNVINQKVAHYTLLKLGHTIDIAENGKIGFEKYKKNFYDVILMDIQMPEMDGIEATNKIRKFENENKITNPIIIVAMTAAVLKGDKEKFIKCGMDYYISKPFTTSEISTILERHVY